MHAPKEKGANICCQASQSALQVLNPTLVLLRVEGLSAFRIPMQFYLNMNVHLLFTVFIMRKGILKQEFNIDISTPRLRQNSCIYTLASKLEAKGWNTTQGLTLGFRGR